MAVSCVKDVRKQKYIDISEHNIHACWYKESTNARTTAHGQRCQLRRLKLNQRPLWLSFSYSQVCLHHRICAWPLELLVTAFEPSPAECFADFKQLPVFQTNGIRKEFQYLKLAMEIDNSNHPGSEPLPKLLCRIPSARTVSVSATIRNTPVLCRNPSAAIISVSEPIRQTGIPVNSYPQHWCPCQLPSTTLVSVSELNDPFSKGGPPPRDFLS